MPIEGRESAEMTESEEKKPVNGYAEVMCDPDGQSASVVLYSPKNGGESVTEEYIISKLNSVGVAVGLDMPKIRDIVKNGTFEKPICVARAIQPKDGINGTITFRYQKERKIEPRHDEHGNTNYRELDIIVPIRKGDIIADITEPTKGEAGLNIFGKPIPAIPGRAATVTVGRNSVITADGKNLIAACDGHIVYGTGCFNVEESVTIKKDLDISVGNINFFGDVRIKGNVMEGFAINAGKNVKIDGSVFGSEINAGGDITIVGGCIKTKIRCEGKASIGFCESADIITKGDIESKQFAFCDVFCYGAVTAKGTNGVICGGHITSMRDVTAGIIGSDKYTQTVINIGDGSVAFARKRHAEAELEETTELYENTVRNLSYLQHCKSIQGSLSETQHKQMISETQKKFRLSMRKKELSVLISQLEYDIENKDELSAICTGVIYPGTKFCINFLTLEVSEVYKRSRVVIIDNQLAVVPI